MTTPFEGVRVTAEDIATGQSDSVVLGRGPTAFVVTCGPDCEVTSQQTYANGTTVLTIRKVRRDEAGA